MDIKPIFEDEEFFYDLRVRERCLKEGSITPEQVQAFLDALPDSEEASEYVDLPEIDPSEGSEIGTARKLTESEDAQEELLTDEL